MNMNRLSAAVFAIFSLSAVAQTKVCIGGDLDHLSPAEITACQQKSAGLQNAAKQVGLREDWHIVMVCDDAGWSDYADFAGKNIAAVMQTVEQTDVRSRTTFVRGSRVEVDNRRVMDRLLASAINQMPADARPTVGKPLPPSTDAMVASVNSSDGDRLVP